MLHDKFVSIVEKICSERYSLIAKQVEAGVISTNGVVGLYPNVLLFVKCPGFYIVELVGAAAVYSGLIVKRTEVSSINKYFYQFSDLCEEPYIRIAADNIAHSNLNIGREGDLAAVVDRFPSVELYPTKLVFMGGAGSVMAFDDIVTNFTVENSLYVNHYQGMYRCKHVKAAYIFRSKVQASGVEEFFSRLYQRSQFSGVDFCDHEEAQKTIVAAQLQNMYLFDRLRETTLGEFLRLHPEVIYKAFDTDHFVYEPSFEWLESDGSNEDSSINPDLMVRRFDGYYDIYDLKTALLGKRSVTKGERRRRRFVDAVGEGLGQLAHYREYFTYPKNAEHALEKYGIRVSDPKLVLIVGNVENTCSAEVQQASRMLQGMTVIDWDTLCKLFMSTGVKPSERAGHADGSIGQD